MKTESTTYLGTLQPLFSQYSTWPGWESLMALYPILFNLQTVSEGPSKVETERGEFRSKDFNFQGKKQTKWPLIESSKGTSSSLMLTKVGSHVGSYGSLMEVWPLRSIEIKNLHLTFTYFKTDYLYSKQGWAPFSFFNISIGLKYTWTILFSVPFLHY